jgi:hypothetical protein
MRNRWPCRAGASGEFLRTDDVVLIAVGLEDAGYGRTMGVCDLHVLGNVAARIDYRGLSGMPDYVREMRQSIGF